MANHGLVIALRAPPDRADAREDFAHMNRLSHHVVDARRKKFERFIQTLVVAERDNGSLRAPADQFRAGPEVIKAAEEKRLNGLQVWLSRRIHPLAELLRRKFRG